MFDYSEGPTGIYSDHRIKTVAWHRHYAGSVYNVPIKGDYLFEGWNSSSGWLRRKTLESMGLEKIADTLQNKGELG